MQSEVIIPKKINDKWHTVLSECGESDVILSPAVCQLDAYETAKKINIENGIVVPQFIEDYLIKNKQLLSEYMAYRGK
jgi:hypothetical protein